MHPNNDERETLRKIRSALAGDHRAFGWIIAKYQKRIYFTVLKMVVNHEDADDVLQETFVKAYTKLDMYDSQYPFYPWLYRIAINTALNHQKKKVRLRVLPIDDFERNHHEAELSEPPRQAFEVAATELSDKLQEALERIPPEQAAIFVLRVNEGLSYQEISDAMDISIGTVMSRLSRAREKLRVFLQPYLDTVDVEC